MVLYRALVIVSLLGLQTLAHDVPCGEENDDAFITFSFRPAHAYYLFEESERTIQFNVTTNFTGPLFLVVRSNNSGIANVSQHTVDIGPLPETTETIFEMTTSPDGLLSATTTTTEAQRTTVKMRDRKKMRTMNNKRNKSKKKKKSQKKSRKNKNHISTTMMASKDGNSSEAFDTDSSDVVADSLVLSNSSDISYTTLDASSTTDVALRNQTTFTVKGVFLGRSYLEFYISSDRSDFHQFMYSATNENFTTERVKLDDGSYWYKLPYKFPVSVIRRRRAIDKIFTYCIMVIVFLANVGLGCKIDLKLVKETLKKPLGPFIGFFCQFLVMPLLAYFLATSMGFDKNIGLGFFALGCSPGGGASNFYTLLLDGDVSLSCTMTILSTVASFGFIPLWIFTLGQHFIEGSDVKIPFTNIVVTLGLMLGAFTIGVIIEWKKKKWSRILVKITAPLIIIAVIIIIVVGVWANLYIFKLYTTNMVLAGCILPYGGFVLGGFIAFGCRLPWKSVKTIAIETGIQNAGVPIVLMAFSLPFPEADLAIVAPGAASLFTPVPLWFAILFRHIWIRVKGYRKLPSSEKEAEANANNNQSEAEYDDSGHEVRVSNL